LDIHLKQITQWKADLLCQAAELVSTAAGKRRQGPGVQTPKRKLSSTSDAELA
jgi:hypothetical protein